MMFKKEIFDKVNGFSDEFSGVLKSADFCLKVRALGKLVVYNPTVEIIYNGEKSIINENEINKFCEKWKQRLEQKDEYYSPNFNLKSANCEIKYDEMEKKEE